MTIHTYEKASGYFSASLPEISMFTFIVIEPLSRLTFGFSNIKILTTRYISNGIVLFPTYNLKDHSEFKKLPFNFPW